jgi:hypothetical protein
VKIEVGKSWLHPVKTPVSDDLLSPHNAFDFDLESEIVSGDYRLIGKLKFEDSHLSSLLQSGEAVGLLHLECPRTFFRTTLLFASDGTLDQMLSHENLCGTAEVLAAIVAIKELSDYSHPNQNLDYGNSVFGVDPASFLAVSETKAIEFFPDLDLIQKVSSLISIKRGKETQKMMEVDPEMDLITVIFPPEEYELYAELRGADEVIKILTNSVVTPALLQAMHHLRSIPEQEFDNFKAEHRWARLILSRLPVEEFPAGWYTGDPKKCMDAVQFLLREPLKASMNEVKELLENVC